MGRFFCASTRSSKAYAEQSYRDGDFFVFGKETKGLPQSILDAYPDTCIRVPMTDKVRSLNLSNSVAIVVFEAFRQLGFPGLD